MVPVLVRDCTDEEMLALALVENLQREDLNAMEAARSYQQLTDDFGLSQAEIAEQVGKSRSTVANTLRLLALPSTIQQAVEENVISKATRVRCSRSSIRRRRPHCFQETVTRGLSVRALEVLVNPAPKAKPRKRTGSASDNDAKIIASPGETCNRP